MQSPHHRATPEALKAITAENQIMSPLLRLPAELRNQIYENVFTDNDEISICADDDCAINLRRRRILKDEGVGHVSHAHCPKYLLALLETCHQTHAETKLMGFGLSKVTGYIHDLHSYIFGDKLNLHQQAAMRSLDVEIDIDERLSGIKPVSHMLLSTIQWQLEDIGMLQGLKELTIRFCYLDSSDEKIEEFADLLKAIIEDAGCREEKKKIEIQVIAQFIDRYGTGATDDFDDFDDSDDSDDSE